MTGVFPAGFPHSEIGGSMDICSSPPLIAAYHVFHRLLVPRHPPCALVRLTFCSSALAIIHRQRFFVDECMIIRSYFLVLVLKNRFFKSVKLNVSNTSYLMSISLQCVVFKVQCDNSRLRSEFVTSQPDSKNFVFLITDILRIS